MIKNLIDRYIYAVTRHLPAKIRDDVDAELRGLISDMLEARCGDVLPTQQDIKVVLTELGTPSELAEKYCSEDKKALISGTYYIKYKFVLKIVLIATGSSMLLAGFIDILANNSEAWYIALCQWVGSVFVGLVMSFGFVTFIFAALEHKGADLDTTDWFDNLPLVPKNKERIKPWEPISGILFSVIFAVVFLACPQIMGGYINNRQWIAVFDSNVIRSMWYIIIAYAMLGMGKETYKLYEGRYTKRLAVLTVITDILMSVLTYFLFANKSLINTVFITEIKKIITGDTNSVITFINNFSLIFAGLIICSLIIDIITTVIYAMKYDKS